MREPFEDARGEGATIVGVWIGHRQPYDLAARTVTPLRSQTEVGQVLEVVVVLQPRRRSMESRALREADELILRGRVELTNECHSLCFVPGRASEFLQELLAA